MVEIHIHAITAFYMNDHICCLHYKHAPVCTTDDNNMVHLLLVTKLLITIGFALSSPIGSHPHPKV